MSNSAADQSKPTHRERTRTRIPRLSVHTLPIRPALTSGQRSRHHRLRKCPATRTRRLRSRLATHPSRTLRTRRKWTPDHPRRPRPRRPSRSRSSSLQRQDLDRMISSSFRRKPAACGTERPSRVAKTGVGHVPFAPRRGREQAQRRSQGMSGAEDGEGDQDRRHLITPYQ